MKRAALIVHLWLSGVVLFGIGCGADEDTLAPDPGALDALNRGWAAYAAGDFSNALLEFERAANLDETLADAQNGIGWARLSLVEGAPESSVLDLAVDAFTEALRKDGNLADAWVGMGQALFLRRASADELRDAARAFASARDVPSETLFRHDYSSLADIYALEAWCYYYTGDLDAARSRANAALEARAETPSARLLVELLR